MRATTLAKITRKIKTNYFLVLESLGLIFQQERGLHMLVAFLSSKINDD